MSRAAPYEIKRSKFSSPPSSFAPSATALGPTTSSSSNAVKEEQETKVEEEHMEVKVEDNVSSKEDNDAMKPQGTGLTSLSKAERDWLLTIPESLMLEVGLEFTNDLAEKEQVTRFFRRYKQLDARLACDHYFDDGQSVPGGWWKKTLHTPSLFGWTFTGIGPTPVIAERSAYAEFLNDPRVRQIAACLVPPSTKIAAVLKERLHGPWRAELFQRGFNCKQIVEEAKQEMIAKFLARGCRNAIADNNV
eukprot:s1858_g5.t1